MRSAYLSECNPMLRKLQSQWTMLRLFVSFACCSYNESTHELRDSKSGSERWLPTIIHCGALVPTFKHSSSTIPEKVYLTSQIRAFHLQSVICYFNQHRASALTRRAPLAMCVQSYRTFPRDPRNIVFITSKQDSDYMNWFKTLCVLLIRGYTRGEGGRKKERELGRMQSEWRQKMPWQNNPQGTAWWNTVWGSFKGWNSLRSSWKPIISVDPRFATAAAP